MAAPIRKFGVEEFRPALPSNAQAGQKAAFDRFAETGLPHHKIEAWKYSSLVHLARTAFQPSPANTELVEQDLPPSLGTDGRIVVVNGQVSRSLSTLSAFGLPPALGAENAKLTSASDPMVSLAQSLTNDGFLIWERGRSCLTGVPIEPRVLEVLYLTVPGLSPQISNFLNVISIEAGAETTLIERHVVVGDGEPTLMNGATHIRIRDGGRLHHVKLQAEGSNANHVWHTVVEVERGCTYNSHVVSTGGLLARNAVSVELLGEGAHCTLDGAYAGRDRQHLDHTSKIVHAVADTTSRQVYKGVLDDNSRGVFQGHIVVAEDAQRTDGHQLNRALMLSDHAEIDSKPMLEIYADDVKCSHGATAGDLDDTQLFYLQSRGIPRDEARRLLVEAFLAETIDGIPFEPAREAALTLVQEHLAR